MRNRLQVSFKGNMWGIGEVKKGRTKRPRSRTLKTYNKKLAKLKKFYQKHPKLQSKYPNFEDWIGKIPLKKVRSESTPRVVVSAQTARRGLGWI